jgi:hypothetical protein
MLPEGKLVLLDGDPDVGKSFLSLDLARRVTLGEAWPDGTPGCAPAGVILVGAEDDLRDTVLPRLQKMGADLSRIKAFQGFTRNNRLVRAPSFPRDIQALRQLIIDTKAKLVIVDPLMQFIDPAYATINDQAIRRALYPLVELARELRCTIILIRHLAKGASLKALYAGSGSIGIAGLSRAAFLIARSPEDPSIRVMAPLKFNIGPTPPSFGYRIVDDGSGPRVEWVGEVLQSADDLRSGKKSNALERAVEFVRGQLQEGKLDFQTLLARARSAGISERTLYRVKEQLPIRTDLDGTGKERKTVWSLMPPDSMEALLATPLQLPGAPTTAG